jgi:hypothetical protein
MSRLTLAERILLSVIVTLMAASVISLAVILIERHCGRGGLLC